MQLLKIYGAYAWKPEEFKNNHTPKAIKKTIDEVRSKLNKSERKKVKIFYSRLRSTSGNFILNSIRKRITNSFALIFDITHLNPNVLFELGIALECLNQNKDNSASVFIICEGKSYKDIKVPSDLQGYFISCYSYNNRTKNIEFHDNNSLVMRILSDIKALLNSDYFEDEN